MEIKISKAAHTCKCCQHEFAHEEELGSTVQLLDGALVREDYCKECWNSMARGGVYSSWTPRFIDPKVASQQAPEVFSPLRGLLYEALDSEDRLERAKAFLAAQLLRRQKAFRFIKETEDLESGDRVSLYLDRIAARLIEVRDLNFTFAELDAARTTLVEQLKVLENPPETKESDSNERPTQEQEPR